MVIAHYASSATLEHRAFAALCLVFALSWPADSLVWLHQLDAGDNECVPLVAAAAFP